MIPSFKDGQTKYDISHLESFEFQVTQPPPKNTNKPALTYDLVSSFSWHCYTRTPEPHESVNRVTRGGETRCFCPIRYKHSFQLPDIIRGLANKKVFQTGKGNLVTIEIIDDDGTKREYEIYFSVSHQGKKRPLKLSIESAYLPEEGAALFSKRKRRQAIRFDVVVYNTKNNKPIKYGK